MSGGRTTGGFTTAAVPRPVSHLKSRKSCSMPVANAFVAIVAMAGTASQPYGDGAGFAGGSAGGSGEKHVPFALPPHAKGPWRRGDRARGLRGVQPAGPLSRD